MNSTSRALSFWLALLCAPAWSAQGGWMQLSEQRRNELRDAVETHRDSQREEVRREETAAGRRLTAAELAELREQVRQQWTPRTEVLHRVDAASVEGAPPGTARMPAAMPAPRSQRP